MLVKCKGWAGRSDGKLLAAASVQDGEVSDALAERPCHTAAENERVTSVAGLPIREPNACWGGCLANGSLGDRAGHISVAPAASPHVRRVAAGIR